MGTIEAFIREFIRHRGEVIEIFFLLIALGIAITVLFGDVFISVRFKEQDLQIQIREVEGAIKNIRNLETYLEKTKSDMIATEEAKVRIEEEYNKVKELEKLTENQLDAISLAVNKRTTTDIIKNYFWGFVLGVSGSLVASYIYGYIKRKKGTISKSSNGEQ